MPEDLDEVLEELGIREFEEDIFEMSRSELREHFGFVSGGVNSSLLIKNLIWQDRGKLERGELEPVHGNIRSYWYARVKPVLSRARARGASKKYDMMIGQFVGMAMDHDLFDYADFGFHDEGGHNRQLGGGNRHVFLVAEKEGHMPLLQEVLRDYDVTIVALGGQPSALSSEYLVSELEAAGFEPEGPVPLITIVDYDPAGDSIARSFMWQLEAVGFEHELVRIDLVLPERLTSEQIRLNKYRLSRRKSERKKNQKWAGRTRGLLDHGHGLLYGLEADAMSWSQLLEAFDAEVLPHLDVPRDQVVRRQLRTPARASSATPRPPGRRASPSPAPGSSLHPPAPRATDAPRPRDRPAWRTRAPPPSP